MEGTSFARVVIYRMQFGNPAVCLNASRECAIIVHRDGADGVLSSVIVSGTRRRNDTVMNTLRHAGGTAKRYAWCVSTVGRQAIASPVAVKASRDETRQEVFNCLPHSY